MTCDGMMHGEPLRCRLEVLSGHTRLFRDEALVAEADAPGFAPSLFGWRPWIERTDDGLRRLGIGLAEDFVSPPVAEALAETVAEAGRLGRVLELALEPDAALADLPWETLSLPGIGPLALHANVALVRRVAGARMTAPAAIPGPLRILVAIGSPEAQNPRGELLDMEAELGRILDATDQSRRAGKAYVRILETGGVAAIRQALMERRYHILHISCHAGPGALILETADGAEDIVDAARFWDEAIPDGEVPPLVVLAGCSTGRDIEREDGAGAGRLPGLARTLVELGVSAVIAMQAPVGDDYATELMEGVYQALWQDPRPLAALAEVRRRLEEARLRRRPGDRPPPEWATPALFTAAASTPLYDPAAPHEDLREPEEPVFDEGVVVRRIGDLVGRRRDQRLIRRALRDPGRGGVLVHGIGGVGKSTLAAHILHQLAVADGALVVSVAGETNPDLLFLALAERLTAAGAHQVAALLRDLKLPWRERFEMLSRALLTRRPLLVLVDNFEDNLTEGEPPTELGAFMARWLTQPGRSRLLITSRYPFPLPDGAGDALEAFHLGPLSWAETRKLLWRLPGLAVLEAEDVQRAWEEVGGHPRALEFLDALLRGGQARFGDVSKRIRKHLSERGIANPAAWCIGKTGDLNAALAETVTLAAADVLLDQLLERLADQPLARRLLFGAAVYRVPVDDLGLIWQVGKPVTYPPDPERDARMLAVRESLSKAQANDPTLTVNDILLPIEGEQWNQDISDKYRPPVKAPTDYEPAKRMLLELSLAGSMRWTPDEAERFHVHRWVATALEVCTGEHERDSIHSAAAGFWSWKAEHRLQPTEFVVDDLLEARHHLYKLKEFDRLLEVTESIVITLETSGAWERERQLIIETLGWISSESKGYAVLLHRMGNVCLHLGDHDGASDWYSKVVEDQGRNNDCDGMAAPYHQLGMIAQLQGRFDDAIDFTNKSLLIDERLGNIAGVAASYHELGMIAWKRGELDSAKIYFNKTLDICKQLGDFSGMAGSYHQLGVLSLKQGDADAAIKWADNALDLLKRIEDRAGIARSYGLLGTIAHSRNEFEVAIGWYRRSLVIKEQIGDRAGEAVTLSQIGALLTQIGQVVEAVPFSLQGLVLHIDMQNPNIHVNLHWLSRQKRALGTDSFYALVIEHFSSDTIAAILSLIDQYEAAQQGLAPTEPAS